jgi:hypothetical protein
VEAMRARVRQRYPGIVQRYESAIA